MNHNRIPERGHMSTASLVIAVIGIAIAGYIALSISKKKK